MALLRLFLLGNDEGDELICPKKIQDISPLIFGIDGSEYIHQQGYPSLTAKFLDLLDSIESKAYFSTDTEYGKVLSVDTTKICRKRANNHNNEDDWIDIGEGTFFNSLGSL